MYTEQKHQEETSSISLNIHHWLNCIAWLIHEHYFNLIFPLVYVVAEKKKSLKIYVKYKCAWKFRIKMLLLKTILWEWMSQRLVLKYPIIQSSSLNFYVGCLFFFLSCLNAGLTYEVNERVAVNLFLWCTFHTLKLYVMLLIESSLQ